MDGVATLEDIVQAVTLVMDPATSQHQRITAYELCERIKQTVKNCSEIGFTLSHTSYTPAVRHFGLQLVEHTIKYHWNDLSVDEKGAIKNNTVKLITKGLDDASCELLFIKDCAARLFVEMIKREWPQQWASMLGELHAICHEGPLQMEVTIMIFGRLIEDVLILQVVPGQRRKEILHTLTDQMPKLFKFFVETLQENFDIYYTTMDSGIVDDKPLEVNKRLIVGVVNLLTTIGDWAQMKLFVADHASLILLLCSMLYYRQLQSVALDCLLVLVRRKVKPNERLPLMVLLEEDKFSLILTAIRDNSALPLDEETYRILNKFCMLVVELGHMLCELWLSAEKFQRPYTLLSLIEALLAFLNHDSQVLSSHTLSLWCTLLKHRKVRHTGILPTVLLRLLDGLSRSLIKNGYPSHADTQRCKFSSIEFFSDDEFSLFYAKHRHECVETIRTVTEVFPQETFQFATSQLEALVQGSLPGCQDEKSFCDVHSEKHVTWELWISFYDTVIGRVQQYNIAMYRQRASQTLKVALNFETQDPLIKSQNISIISSLLTFISDQSLLVMTLDKLFADVVFVIPGEEIERSKPVRNVRRHACAVVLKITKCCSELLMPNFEQLYNHVMGLISTSELLCTVEKCLLLEALVKLSNEFNDREKQRQLLNEIIDPVRKMTSEPELRRAIGSAGQLMSYIGLDQTPTEWKYTALDSYALHRMQIMQWTSIVRSIIKRVNPIVTSECSATTGRDESSHLAGVLLPLFADIFALLGSLHELFLPENIGRLNVHYSRSYELPDSEKNALLGMYASHFEPKDSSKKTPAERTQRFLHALHENCYTILSAAGECLGEEYYRTPDLSSSVHRTFISSIQVLPDFRVRFIMRQFLRPYIQHCPAKLQELSVVPVLNAFLPFMHMLLGKRWTMLKEKLDQIPETVDPVQEREEMVEEELTRHMTRDYLDLLLACMLGRKSDMEQAEGDDMLVDVPDTSKKNQEMDISSLGMMLIRNEELYHSIITTIFSLVSCPDSSVCMKCNSLCWPLIKQLIENDRLCAQDGDYLLTSLLEALSVHGQHDVLLAILLNTSLNIYEHLRSRFTEASHCIVRLAGCDQKKVEEFDNKIQETVKPLPQKKKRELFRNLIDSIIGRNVGQLFKKDLIIRNLQPLSCLRPKPAPVDVTETTDIGLCALFSPDTCNTNSVSS